MSAAEQIGLLAAELDEFAFRQDFPAVAERVTRLTELVRRLGRDYPPAEAAALAAESLRMIETARRKVCVSRARMQECKHRLERAAEYCFAHSAAVHTWTVEG